MRAMTTAPSDADLPQAPRLRLAHLPTPIEHFPALDACVGTEVWVKRDDATLGAEAGNKLRKLEYLMAVALAQRADVVITCGGLQSNHARATAIIARRFGMAPLLLLRTDGGHVPSAREGNLLLDELVGAELRFISPAEYAQRDQRMPEIAAELERQGHRAYVIPEGGSNGIGALGYYTAMAEVRAQLDAGSAQLPSSFDAVVHACGSGGTAAGVQLGARTFGVAQRAIAMAVCDDARYFQARVAGIVRDALRNFNRAPALAHLEIEDAYKGPAYAVPSPEQIAFIRQVARATGLILDPVYSGKALYGLAHLRHKPARTLFIHTGGLPGLLGDHARFFAP